MCWIQGNFEKPVLRVKKARLHNDAVVSLLKKSFYPKRSGSVQRKTLQQLKDLKQVQGSFIQPHGVVQQNCSSLVQHTKQQTHAGVRRMN